MNIKLKPIKIIIILEIIIFLLFVYANYFHTFLNNQPKYVFILASELKGVSHKTALNSLVTIPAFNVNKNIDVISCLNGFTNKGYWLQNCIIRENFSSIQYYIFQYQIWNSSGILNSKAFMININKPKSSKFNLSIIIEKNGRTNFTEIYLKNNQSLSYTTNKTYGSYFNEGTNKMPTSLWVEYHYNNMSNIPKSIIIESSTYNISLDNYNVQTSGANLITINNKHVDNPVNLFLYNSTIGIANIGKTALFFYK